MPSAAGNPNGISNGDRPPHSHPVLEQNGAMTPFQGGTGENSKPGSLVTIPMPPMAREKVDGNFELPLGFDVHPDLLATTDLLYTNKSQVTKGKRDTTIKNHTWTDSEDEVLMDLVELALRITGRHLGAKEMRSIAAAMHRLCPTTNNVGYNTMHSRFNRAGGKPGGGKLTPKYEELKLKLTKDV